MSGMLRRRCGAGVAAILAATLLAGCGLDLQSLPSPAGTSGATYDLKAMFTEVQNLTEGAKVKIGGVVIGDVQSISTHDYRAEVDMSIEKKFTLGKDARLQVRFTTPLGEQYLSVIARGNVRKGVLADGAVLPLRNTSNAPGVEDAFAALSTLLNHGGLDNLQTIASELTRALRGRAGTARDVLIQTHKVIVNLDRHKGDIDRTLDNVAKLSQTLNDGTPLIEEALAVLPSTLRTLAADTSRIRTLLTKVGRLGTTVEGLLARSENALLTDFDNLRPTLAALRRRESILVPTFRSLIKVGKLLRRAAPGDYLNVSGTVQFLLNADPARPTKGGIVRSGAEPNSMAAVRQLMTGGLT